MRLFPKSFIAKIESGELVDYDELKNSVLKLNESIKKYSDFKNFLSSIDTSDVKAARVALQSALEEAKEIENDEQVKVLEGILKLSDDELAEGVATAASNWAEKSQSGGQPKPNFTETVNLFDQEIFSAGDYGKKGKYSVDDLKVIVENSRKLKDKIKPPIKLGHFSVVDTGLPSLGWVENLRVDGEKLIADYKEVPKKIADLLRTKGYRRVSAEIYAEPVHGCTPPALRAVALLGSDIPEVKTLEDIQTLYNAEGEPKFDIVNFTEQKNEQKNDDKNVQGGKEMDILKNRLATLERENVDMKINEFMEKNKAKVLPTYEPILRAVLTETFTEEKVVTFSEGEGENKGQEVKIKLGEAIQTLFSRLPDIVKLDEMSKGDPTKVTDEDDRMKKIEEYMEKNKCSLADARQALGIDFTEKV